MSTDAKAGNRNIRRGDAKLAAVSRVPQRWDILRAGIAKQGAHGGYKRTKKQFKRKTYLSTAAAEAFNYRA